MCDGASPGPKSGRLNRFCLGAPGPCGKAFRPRAPNSGMSTIAGYGTAEGTAAFGHRATERHALPRSYFRRAPTGLTLSSLGLGTV